MLYRKKFKPGGFPDKVSRSGYVWKLREDPVKRDTEEPRESETKKIVLGGTERNEDKKNIYGKCWP